MEEILRRFYRKISYNPVPPFNIGTESPHKQIYSNGGNLASDRTVANVKKGVRVCATASYKMPIM